MSGGIPIRGERHFNVRMHENWSAEMPLEMLTNPVFFFAPGDMSTVTPDFIQWVRDNGNVDEEWTELDDDAERSELSQEFYYDDAVLTDRWREAVHHRTTTLGFDQWRENLIQAWKLQARAAEDFRRTQALNIVKGVEL